MNGNINININVNMDPRFTEALCFLASALGYPAPTQASSMKATAKAFAEQKMELKQAEATAMEAMGPEKFAEKLAEEWTVESITPVLSGYLKKGVTTKDMSRELARFKNGSGNPIQGIKELIDEKGREDVDSFLKALRAYFKEGE